MDRSRACTKMPIFLFNRQKVGAYLDFFLWRHFGKIGLMPKIFCSIVWRVLLEVVLSPILFFLELDGKCKVKKNVKIQNSAYFWPLNNKKILSNLCNTGSVPKLPGMIFVVGNTTWQGFGLSGGCELRNKAGLGCLRAVVEAGIYCSLAEKKNGPVFGAVLCNVMQVLCETGQKQGADAPFRKPTLTTWWNKAKLSCGTRGSGKVGSPSTTTTTRDARRHHKRMTRCKRCAMFWTRTGD